MPRYDVAIIGGGIVGLAVALDLARRTRARLVVLEAEPRVAAHQTGHNSGVIHSGLYYRPGSHKARLCAEGRESLYRFCAERGVPHERCGKVVVAADAEEVARLDELERRGAANGLAGLRRLSRDELAAREPHVAAAAALLVPDTGIVDYRAVAEAFAAEVGALGGEVRTGVRLLRGRRAGGALVLETTAGRFEPGALVNCAGLRSDQVARRCGLDPGVRIVPFRGEYYELTPGRRALVRHLVYPVPDPRYPFLGVHFTRTIGGVVEAGPNAVLALAREGYSKTSLSVADVADWAAFPGAWRLFARHWRMGLGEVRRSWSKRRFTASLRRLVPSIVEADLVPGGAGVRAQAVDRDGALVDDFRFVRAPGQIHVLNAPSPAATASLAIGREVAGMAIDAFGLAERAASGAGPARPA